MHIPRTIQLCFYRNKGGAVFLRRKSYKISNFENVPTAGDRIHGYFVERTKHIGELDLTAILLKHEKTGAEHLHLMKNDKNNVFAVGFHTPPPDSTGVPHILVRL
ncbi:hypothetical protein PCK2_000201 [Pneumocystis canis]|nr:hypothetical protein PCK2_000201 [Pneumocystis canis]